MACIEWNYLTPLISCRFLTPSQVPVITAKPLCLNFLKISYKMVMFFIYGWFLFWFWIQMSKLHVETVDHFVHKSAISNDINLHMPDFLSKKFDLMSDQKRIEGCFMMEKLLTIQSWRKVWKSLGEVLMWWHNLPPFSEWDKMISQNWEGGALCVKVGFYANISCESRCNIEINVWAHFYKIFEVPYQARVKGMHGKS